MSKMIFKAFSLVVVFSLLIFALPTTPVVQADSSQNYIILYSQNAVPDNAASTISSAGGSLIYSYPQIGVVIASSDNPSFRANLLRDKRIENAASTGSFGVQLQDQVLSVGTASDFLAAGQASVDPWGDPLSNLQWDMFQIHVPEAQAVNAGSPSVVVGDIDTGLDWTHPDLAPNVDFADSVSCINGVPNQDPSAWMDDNGHGTHTAGTIAAAANGIGIIGVAPNVRIAGIKAANADGYLFPEAVVCSFMWAGTHHIDVTNNSYYVDPWLFNCRNDPVQRAIWKALQRAIRFAQNQGVVVVAATTNFNMDLSKQNVDTSSPDDSPTPLTRDVTNACVVIPAEIPGVVGVSADGAFLQKAYYSSYGVGVVQVTAPGGDARFQRTDDDAIGAVLSTFPGNRYALFQGTSMASPHVAGVAALILSQFGRMPQGFVQAMLTQTADPMACPPNPFDPGGTGSYLATCVGGTGYNGFYGNGQVNAYSAVTHTP